MTSAVAIRDVAKTFGATKALRGVDLDLGRGEVHTLLGGNGSGKSTLIKILAGVQPPDGGALRVGTAWQDLGGWDSEQARAVGMRFVHQDPCLFPALSVAENLAAEGGLAPRSLAPIRWRALRRRSARLLERFELDIDPAAPLATLGPAQRAMVAIARALHDADESEDGALLVLDEPTASLPRHEVELLLAAVRRMAAQGHMVLYVTHRLDEVFAVTDRVTVLRNGAVVATRATSELDEDALVELITGRRVEQVERRLVAEHRSERPALAVSGLSSARLHDVSFELQPGEILGIAGMVGSGRSELLRVLCGDRRRSAGTVLLHGEAVDFGSPLDAKRAGVVYVPEHRRESTFPDMSVDGNLAAASLEDYYTGGRLRDRAQRRDSRELAERFAIVTASVSQPLRSLSGGNQQKVVMARWLRTRPRVLLLDEPSHGVDVGARADIYRLVRESTDAGAAAIVVASDPQELAQVSDRVLVLRDGAVVAELRPPHIDPTTLDESLYRTKES